MKPVVFLKAHVKDYDRKDGAHVVAHDDKRPAAKKDWHVTQQIEGDEVVHSSHESREMANAHMFGHAKNLEGDDDELSVSGPAPHGITDLYSKKSGHRSKENKFKPKYSADEAARIKAGHEASRGDVEALDRRGRAADRRVVLAKKKPAEPTKD